MTHQPYNRATDEAFDQIIHSYYRHPGGRTMTPHDRTHEDRRGQAMVLMGCSSVVLALCVGAALIIAAWRLL